MIPSQARFFVPGFGCSYLCEYEDAQGPPQFVLRFLRCNDSWSWTPNAPGVLFVLEAGRAEWLESAPARGKKKIESGWSTFDFAQWLILAAGQPIVVRSRSHLLKLAIVGFSEDDTEACAREYKLNRSDLANAFRLIRPMSNSVWISELCHRVIFERALAQRPQSVASHFCRQELMKEAYYQVHSTGPAQSGFVEPRLHELSPTMKKVLLFLETELHTPLTIERLSRAAALSPSALSRMFRRELARSPLKYVWERRLHDARLLLMTGRYRVSEVAAQVGFSDISSFSQAYSRMFGLPPSMSRAFD